MRIDFFIAVIALGVTACASGRDLVGEASLPTGSLACLVSAEAQEYRLHDAAQRPDWAAEAQATLSTALETKLAARQVSTECVTPSPAALDRLAGSIESALADAAEAEDEAGVPTPTLDQLPAEILSPHPIMFVRTSVFSQSLTLQLARRFLGLATGATNQELEDTRTWLTVIDPQSREIVYHRRVDGGDPRYPETAEQLVRRLISDGFADAN